MKESLSFQSANTILYCRRWPETVAFYQERLGLPVSHAADWFIEFRLAGAAYLSIADEARATLKSSGGAGVTVTLKVDDIEAAHRYLDGRGLAPGPIREHPWGARLFYFYDPEGHRLEIWAESKTV